MNKTVVITGGAVGIGKQLVIDFAKKGFNIIFSYFKHENEAKDLKEFIKNNYEVNCDIFKFDIRKEEEIKEFYDFTINKYNMVDILINNIGYASDNYIDDKTKEEFMNVLEINVCGTFLVTKYFYKNVTNCIVNISSLDAVSSYNPISMDYCASKAGVNSLTKNFALEFKNLKVISVMPKWTNTEEVQKMNPEYLKEELKRTNQDSLDDVGYVSNRIIEYIFDDNVISGDILKI